MTSFMVLSPLFVGEDQEAVVGFHAVFGDILKRGDYRRWGLLRRYGVEHASSTLQPDSANLAGSPTAPDVFS